MASTYKVLGQSIPTSGSVAVLYQVPGGASAICSTLTVANQGVSTLVRVAVQPASASLSPKHYIAYDVTVNQYDTMFLTLALTLAATDVVSVYNTNSSASFNLFGTEIT